MFSWTDRTSVLRRRILNASMRVKMLTSPAHIVFILQGLARGWAKFIYIIWVSPCVSFPAENSLQLFVFISWGCFFFFSGSSSSKAKKGSEGVLSWWDGSLSIFSSHLDPSHSAAVR